MHLSPAILGGSAILRLRLVEKSLVHNEIVHLRNGSLQTCRKKFTFNCRIYLVWMSRYNAYHNAFDKKRVASRTADQWPFSAEPDSLVPACVRTALCPDRLVDVIRECKNPKRMALTPIEFHHLRRTRTNFLCRFSADPLRNHCDTAREHTKIQHNYFPYLLWTKHVNDFFKFFFFTVGAVIESLCLK